MAAPIPPMLKYSIVHNVLNSPPILIKFVLKFIVCKVLHFEAQFALRLHSPLIKTSFNTFVLKYLNDKPFVLPYSHKRILEFITFAVAYF